MTVRDLVLVVIIPLVLAELGPWCGWLSSRLLPWAARLRYGDTERAEVRLEEWSACSKKTRLKEAGHAGQSANR